jgi:hypothetical protein
MKYREGRWVKELQIYRHLSNAHIDNYLQYNRICKNSISMRSVKRFVIDAQKFTTGTQQYPN